MRSHAGLLLLAHSAAGATMAPTAATGSPHAWGGGMHADGQPRASHTPPGFGGMTDAPAFRFFKAPATETPSTAPPATTRPTGVNGAPRFSTPPPTNGAPRFSTESPTNGAAGFSTPSPTFAAPRFSTPSPTNVAPGFSTPVMTDAPTFRFSSATPAPTGRAGNYTLVMTDAPTGRAPAVPQGNYTPVMTDAPSAAPTTSPTGTPAVPQGNFTPPRTTLSPSAGFFTPPAPPAPPQGNFTPPRTTPSPSAGFFTPFATFATGAPSVLTAATPSGTPAGKAAQPTTQLPTKAWQQATGAPSVLTAATPSGTPAWKAAQPTTQSPTKAWQQATGAPAVKQATKAPAVKAVPAASASPSAQGRATATPSAGLVKPGDLLRQFVFHLVGDGPLGKPDLQAAVAGARAALEKLMSLLVGAPVGKSVKKITGKKACVIPKSRAAGGILRSDLANKDRCADVADSVANGGKRRASRPLSGAAQGEWVPMYWAEVQTDGTEGAHDEAVKAALDNSEEVWVHHDAAGELDFPEGAAPREQEDGSSVDGGVLGGVFAAVAALAGAAVFAAVAVRRRRQAGSAPSPAMPLRSQDSEAELGQGKYDEAKGEQVLD